MNFKKGDRLSVEGVVEEIDANDQALPWGLRTDGKYIIWVGEKDEPRLVSPAEGGSRADSPLLGFADSETEPPAEAGDTSYENFRLLHDKSEIDQNIGRLEGALSLLDTDKPAFTLLVGVILDMLKQQQRQLREAIEATQK